jgi:hypothetical protein
MAQYEVGQRVKLTAPMVNKNSTWMPVEDGMPVGLEGTITYVSLDGPREWHQLGVKWDNGRSLGLLPGKDSFVVIREPANVPTTT